MNSLHNHQVQQALLAVENEDIALLDKVEMLMQVAMGLQHKPKKRRTVVRCNNSL